MGDRSAGGALGRVVAAAAVAVLLACASQLLPLLKRIWRLPQVLVSPEEKAADALRVGLLGASFIGRSAVVHAADKRRDVVVVAVAARSAAKAAEFAAKFSIPASHGGDGAYEALIQDPNVDVVYVGLPTRMHRHWVLAALSAGKHVLVEKPAGANAAETVELHHAQVRAGRVLMEGTHYRHHPANRRIQEIVLTGELGQLKSIGVRFSMFDPKAWLATIMGRMPIPGSKERLHERVKNLDRWWYCVDALLWASGATSARVLSAVEGRFSLSAELSLTLPAAGDGTEDRTVHATVEMARDMLTSPFDWSLSALGTNGTARLSNLGFPFLWHAIDIQTDSGGLRREQLYGQGETTFEHQLAAFAAAVRGAGSGRFAGFDEVSLTMRLVDEILEVAGTGPIPSESLTL